MSGPVKVVLLMGALSAGLSSLAVEVDSVSYPVVDTGQVACYGDSAKIRCPEKPTAAFHGQDAQYGGRQPAYTDNGDGTVTDDNTGLMWQKSPGPKMTYRQAVQGAARFELAGYEDWRLPTIKELYSLILFSGTDPDPRSAGTGSKLRPFIDTDSFDFEYGDPNEGERIIDSQYLSGTKYVGRTMRGSETVFGVNFADGRIKGYGLRAPRGRGDKKFHVMHVRGGEHYGENVFVDNGDGTITDAATGLMWMKVDSGHLKAGDGQDGALDWKQALAWAEGLDHAGHSDWRLPDAKELQSVVDYSRSPGTTRSAAIDPLFQVSRIVDEGGNEDYPFYWTGTTHAGLSRGGSAVYLAFGTSQGWMRDPRTGRRELLDVHGAGSQRSDPKAGDPGKFPHGRGPQGDVVRIYNHARCVRDAQ